MDIDIEDPNANIEPEPIDPKKLARLEKEKKELLAALAGADFSTQKTKVAWVLNMVPEARNSDITLALKYWETFQPDIYNPTGILPKDLFKLDRLHFIARARAKIQNEYGLFPADEAVRNHRRKHEEAMFNAVIADAPARRIINVFADETGKNDQYVIVAAVWVLTGRAVFTVSQAIKQWKDSSAWARREIHFTKFGKNDFDPLNEYLALILQNREYLSFKVIAIDRSKTKRKIEEVVEKLHEHMLLRGATHEVSENRVDLPREIEMTVDEEQSLDAFCLAEMQARVSSSLELAFGDELKLTSIKTASSRTSQLIQLADLIAGAVNRRLNHKGERNHKDDMADWIIHTLDLTLAEGGVPGLDASALFVV